MILFDTGSTICLQQTVSGTGVYDGTQVGYARLTYSNGGVVFTVRATQVGTAGNALKLALVAPTDSTQTVAGFDGTTVTVFLKRTAGVISATAAEVVAAVNALFSSKPSSDLKMTAAVGTAGTIPAVLAATSLAGGIDPTVVNPALLKFAQATNSNGGMFYFEQTRAWVISSVTARFSAAGLPIKIAIVNIDNALNPVTNEEVAVWEPTTTDNYAALEDMKTPVMPGQALTITATAQGMVRVTARAESPTAF
jgi:hypothetical protein